MPEIEAAASSCEGARSLWRALPASPVAELRARGFNAVEILLTAVAFFLLRFFGAIADTPYWVYLLLLVGGGLVGAVVVARWGSQRTMHLHAQIATSVAVTTAVIYATGWGPTLAIGYMFVAADAIKRFGSRGVRPTLGWSMVGILLGEMAIASGIAPSRFSSPGVHGLALMAALGTGFAIYAMGLATIKKEQAETEVRRSEERFRSLVQNSSDVVAVVDKLGRLNYVSPAIRRLGFSPEEFLQLGADNSLTNVIHPDDIPMIREVFGRVLTGTESGVVRQEVRLLHADGSWRWQEVNYTNLCDHPSVEGIVVNFHDITERRAYEQRLAHEARHDSLTGLANRKAFLDRLGQGLARARRHRTGVAVIFVDLDRFKLINDSLGHNLGDQLLVEVARRIPECLRPEDTVARLSGDEFTVLIEDVHDPSDAIRTAERLADVFRQPIAVNSGELVVTASVGVAVSPVGAESAEDLLCQADLAMYAAKEGGRARAVMFDHGNTPQFVDRVELEAGLRSAIDRGELELHYQPIVALPAHSVSGFEALLRWHHPGRGLLPPGSFIGLAEDTGLIIPVGRWVMETACRAVAALHARSGISDLTVSVNVSAVQLHQPGFVSDVAGILAESGLPPHCLVLELTESVLVRAEATAGVLHDLHELGVKIALDDFGTGYSSLAYLRRLPLDFVKIDRSFVSGLDGQGADTAIVRAIVDLAHTLGLITIAEGIETEEQARTLTALGCVLAQGFLYGHPGPLCPADALVALSGARVIALGANGASGSDGVIEGRRCVDQVEQRGPRLR